MKVFLHRAVPCRCTDSRESATRKIWTAAVALLLTTGGSPAASAQTYIAIDLHPSGFASSEARGVADGQQVGAGVGPTTSGQRHALLWTGAANSVVDLHPSGYASSEARGIADGQQVGLGNSGSPLFFTSAFLWSGTAESVVKLGDGFAFANAIRDGQQVGATGDNVQHALLWTGSAQSVVDLHPRGYFLSQTWGVADGQQVGLGTWPESGREIHALLWWGTADSFVDLHPSGFESSVALGLADGQQVGYGGVPGGGRHALLWSGTAASVVDLHPTGYVVSEGHGIANGQQVGYGASPGAPVHGLLWSGTAASVLDLHQFLPEGYNESLALGIDSEGNIVGSARGPATGGNYHAILWRAMPCAMGPPKRLSLAACQPAEGRR